MSSPSEREFRARLLELVAAAVMLAILSFVVTIPSWAQATPGSAAEKLQRAPADSSAKTLADLPPAILPAISSALGRDDKLYGMQKTADGYSAQNAANHLAAHFAAKGVEIQSENANLGFEFRGWRYGEHVTEESTAAIAPRANANRVEYRRGALTEWYVNGPLGIEQGFTISEPPVTFPDSNHDALDISLRLRGNLNASVEPGRHAITLRDQKGAQALRYGPLLAYDASGRELESWMEVRDGSLLLRVKTAGAHYPIIVDPWVQAAKLTNSLGFAVDSFGRSVAVSGNTVVVGAPFATVNGNAEQGAAYVFVEPAGGWGTTGTYTAELINNSGAAVDNFGSSVGISGNTVVVGAPQANTGLGAAYVFVEPASGVWITPAGNPTYNAILTESAEVADDLIGSSVGISGNTIVVGAPQANATQGAAYVFVEPTWSGSLTSNIELAASNGATGDYLGYSVGINESGNTIVVGAPGSPAGSGTTPGAAYVFVEPMSGVWVTPTGIPTFSAELLASDGVTGDALGTSVGISGNTVVAGANRAKIGSTVAQGAAYVFVEPVGGWLLSENQDAKLTASSGTFQASLGNSVGISGNTVVAGAQGVSLATGAAYVFVEPTTTNGWADQPSENETAELTAAAGATNSFLGYSAGISGNTVVAGAPAVSFGSNPTQGAAYVFTQASVPAYAQYSTTQVNFGNVVDNIPATQTVTVMNTGNQPLIIQLVIPSADGTILAVTQSACNGIVSSPPVYPITISSNGSCTFTVQFDPTAPGAVNVQLGFTDNAGAGESNLTSTPEGQYFLQSVPLSGTGITGFAATTTITSTTSSVHGEAINENAALVATPVTVNYTVQPSTSGNPIPTGGTVTVTDNLVPPDSCTGTPTNGVGSCQLDITQYNGGSTQLVAAYTAPPTGFLPSISAPFTENIFEIAAPCNGLAPAAPPVRQGGTEVYTILFCLSGNISAAPALVYDEACFIQGVCKFKTISLGGGVYELTGTITAGIPGCFSSSGCEPSSGTSSHLLPSWRWPRSGPRRPLALFAFATLLAMCMAFLLVRRRGRRPRLVYSAGLILALALAGISGCTTSPPVTPVGTYTVNVTIQAGGFSVVVPVIVQVTQ